MKKSHPNKFLKFSYREDPWRSQDQLRCCCTSNKKLSCSNGCKIDQFLKKNQFVKNKNAFCIIIQTEFAKKTSKIIIPEISLSQWVYKKLVCQPIKNMAAFLRYLLPENLKQVGYKSKFGPEKSQILKNLA